MKALIKYQDFAMFYYTAKENDTVAYRIGLDSVYRLTGTNEGTYAAFGSWTTPYTFTIDYELIGYSTRGAWKLTFDADEIAVEEVGVTGVYTYSGKKQLK